MLSRRALRIKVMQALYGLEQNYRALHYTAHDRLREHFAPDLNAPEPTDPEILRAQAVLAAETLDHLFSHQGDLPAREDLTAEVRDAAVVAYRGYERQRAEEPRRARRHLAARADQVYDLYLQVISLVPALADEVLRAEEHKKTRLLKQAPATQRELRLAHNPLVTALRESEALAAALARHGVGWEGQQPFVRQLYRDELVKAETYQAYQRAPEADLETHTELLRWLVREVLIKSAAATAHFEQEAPNWHEDQTAVRSMVTRTLKSAASGEVALSPVSPDWEEDRAFMLELYDQAVAQDETYEQLVADKTLNWDAERIALTDKVILKMALAEMMHFPSIPVKVTINEYIDISKRYSTPKSRQFINGLLDVLAEELRATGRIRKSGRGLLDNR